MLMVVAALLLHGVLLNAFQPSPPATLPTADRPLVAHLLPTAAAEPAVTATAAAPPLTPPPPAPAEHPTPRPSPTPPPKVAAASVAKQPPKPTVPPINEIDQPASVRHTPIATLPSAEILSTQGDQENTVKPQQAKEPQFEPQRLVSEITLHLGDHLSYPPLARRRGWQGTVTLRCQISSNGVLSQRSVAMSSGYPLLDQAALRALERIKQITPTAIVPDGLELNIPITFLLEQG
jgi:periplasmic protein TonB